MRRLITRRTRIGGALLALFPALLCAQSSPARGGIVAAVGVGAGSASFTCDVCGSGRDNGGSGVARIGVRVRSGLVVAVEGSGWTSDYTDPRGTGTVRMLFASAVAQWYPRGARGGFLKAGGGGGSIREKLTLTGIGDVTVTTSGPAFVAGVGWDLPIGGGRWAITPYADVNVISKAEQSLNGSRPGSRLGASVVHLGVAVTLR